MTTQKVTSEITEYSPEKEVEADSIDSESSFLQRFRSICNRDETLFFFDWHEPRMLLLSMGSIAMSAMDAFFTLRLLELGMIEANPVMLAAIEAGLTVFILTKMTLTGIGVFILVYLAKAKMLKFLRVGYLLTVIFLMYASLISWELYNLSILS